MKTSRLFAYVIVVGAIACRSTGTPMITPEPDAGDMDTAAMDTPITPGDNPVTPTDNPVGTDVRPPRDIGPCDRTGLENTAAACADGRDNDCNGFTDCVDFACSSFCRDGGAPPTDRVAPLDTTGCVRMGAESTPAACGDGLDNDCDGFADCNDRNCSCLGACGPSSFGARGCMCDGRVAEGSTAGQCTDMRDNDCNGYTDTMDFGCTPRDGGAADVTRDVVMRLDTNGCVPSGTGPEATCGDGMDNDCNGFADCNDFACSCVGTCGPSTRAPTCTCMGTEASDGTCNDRMDNDCDGFTDCMDFSCSMTPAVTLCPSDGGAPRG